MVSQFTLFLVFLPGSLLAQLPTDPPINEMKFESLRSGTPVVNVRLNGTLDARFLLDTGAIVSYLSDATAAKLGLKVTDSAQLDGRKVQTYTVSRLQLGAWTFENARLVPLGDKLLKGADHERIDGILGANVFSAFQTMISFVSKEVGLRRWADVGDAYDKKFVEAGGLLLTMRKGEDGRFWVVSKLNGVVEEELMFDLGAFATRISRKAAQQLGLKSGRKGSVAGVGWRGTRHYVTLKSLELGPKQFEGLEVGFDEPEGPSVLGLDILRQFDIFFDGPMKKLYLRPVPKVFQPLDLTQPSPTSSAPSTTESLHNTHGDP